MDVQYIVKVLVLIDMIYLHRFIYAIIAVPLLLISWIIMLVTFIITTPFYAIIYYVKYGSLVSDKQVEKWCEFPTYPIFKFLELIKPNN